MGLRISTVFSQVKCQKSESQYAILTFLGPPVGVGGYILAISHRRYSPINIFLWITAY